MKDKLNITIRVAELPPIPLQINREEEEIVRNAEYNVNRLWRQWMQRFHDKSAYEVLGMVAFQFAKTFVVLNKQSETVGKMLDDFEAELDAILLRLDDTGKATNMAPSLFSDEKADTEKTIK